MTPRFVSVVSFFMVRMISGCVARVKRKLSMSFDPSRRLVLQAGMALSASALWVPARACEFTTPYLRVTHPWTRVTPEDAPYAIVSMKIDQVSREERLIGVETPVATRAEIGGISTGGGISATGGAAMNLLIERGRELRMSEQGVHVRLLGLTQPLLIGRSYPMRLIFAQGGAMDAELNVDYMAQGQ
jgi:hypothetical protein